MIWYDAILYRCDIYDIYIMLYDIGVISMILCDTIWWFCYIYDMILCDTRYDIDVWYLWYYMISKGSEGSCTLHAAGIGAARSERGSSARGDTKPSILRGTIPARCSSRQSFGRQSTTQCPSASSWWSRRILRQRKREPWSGSLERPFGDRSAIFYHSTIQPLYDYR